MALSQTSTTSSVCMIPPDLADHQDAEFYSEIVEVNDLYFGNFEVEDIEIKSDHNHDSDDNDSESDSGCDNANISHNLNNDGDLSGADKSEYDMLSQFKKQTCGCNRLYESPCSANVDWESVIAYRRHCQEMTNDELDVAIKFQLFHHRRNDSVTDKKKHKSKERERSTLEYFLSGKHVCRVTFAFAHGVNRKKVDAIAQSLDNEGLGARSHGNKGTLPKHALTLNDVQTIKQFVISYGNKFGLPLPGRLPNYREHKSVLLPSDKTKYDIYTDYVSAAEEVGLRKVSLSEFKKIWLEQCPHIMIMRPTTDLCHKCQSYVTCIQNSGSLSEEEKCELLNEYSPKCKIQRQEYRTQCNEAKINFSQLPDDKKIRGQAECSNQTRMHYSFDYALQVHYLHYAQQVGSLFFKTPRKCQCFGVCAEGSGSQIFYLVDETEYTGKVANTVASMLHHHFLNRGYGEKDVSLHMDYCSIQNKNNTVIGYGLWRVMTARHE
ncbi:LOW QUALITY PROTEIN: hypothetical protein KUTeg_002547 [Tegillarca granosa]|uniref:Uncharacterized protein n=1 Tax=Tegillarca granosa TaxID=220873 RepID=A0ABQ9FUQ5_TEGGR|nr:LOW QUALITY PROTEIN: hypothetical protein KUTeg_002547 [Tegillarca granosa]